MHFVSTRDAVRLTGLSTEQLREWTSRRELIPADIKPKGHGSPARFTWQTILLLRLAVVLRDRFKVELQVHRELFADLRTALGSLSFVSLWGKALLLQGGADWQLVSRETATPDIDCVVLWLDPHLKLLSEGFSLPPPSTSTQFSLFPAMGVVSDGRGVGSMRRG
ncbi:MerR family transcriptional regulator [Cupriavidus sp. H39]|uniref:MerR family transcriptional regulator n=1 Tax=Cupriavidus sp. H39 TaxID=3401635 RepID=UPI003D093A07